MCVVSVGGAAVVGDVLQATEQSRVVIWTDPLGGRLTLQRQAALPGRCLSGADHTVDLLQTLRDQRSKCQRVRGHRVRIKSINMCFFNLKLKQQR